MSTTWQKAVMLLAVLGTTASGAVLAAPAGAASDQGRVPPTMRTVRYAGVSFAVPRTWPVLRLAGRAGCVRFDRHAVYLGDPARSTCSPHLVGRTSAVHVTAGGVVGLTAKDRVVVPAGRSRRLAVVVSAGASSTVVRRIATSVRFQGARPVVRNPQSFLRRVTTAIPTAGAVHRGRARALTSDGSTAESRTSRRAAVGPRDTTYAGSGFDACAAQPLTTMATWFAASPYKSANIYIGGASRSCAQPNLTADWVAQTVAQGWTLIPTYVGLQAPCTNFPNRIDPAQPVAQATASADDAIAQLDALGLRIGNPVYLDMEAFSTSNAACLATTQAFVDQWTARLHERGYVSGVYSSVSSLAPLLVSRQGDASFHQPDDIWFARWPASSATQPGDPTLTDPLIPDTYWGNHQRIHQYRGGHPETWGGVTVTIDNDSLDAAVAPSQLAADGAFVQISGVPAVFRIAGGAPLAVTDWAVVGGQQPVATLSQSQFDSLPDRPAEGTFLQSGNTGRVWRVVKGVATYVPDWAPYGGPQPSIVVDQAALDNAGTGGFWNLLSSGTPVAPRTTGPVTPGTIASKASFTWFGGYTSSAIRSYDVRWRKSRWDGTFGPWTYPVSWRATPVSDVPLGLRAGETSCVSVRATNRAGQTSGWSSDGCTARALDDRSLAASGGWTRRRGPAFFGGSTLSTTTKGVSVTRAGARVRRVGVVATLCKTCGSLEVLVDGKRIGRLRLVAAVRHRHQVLMLPAFALGHHTITVRTTTRSRLVQVDGVVLSRH